eukprot:3404366-Lingulodinium_polyedra.AAC.1
MPRVLDRPPESAQCIRPVAVILATANGGPPTKIPPGQSGVACSPVGRVPSKALKARAMVAVRRRHSGKASTRATSCLPRTSISASLMAAHNASAIR